MEAVRRPPKTEHVKIIERYSWRPGGFDVLCLCGKRPYEDEEYARLAMRALNEAGTGREVTAVYACKRNPGLWHTTSKPQ